DLNAVLAKAARQLHAAGLIKGWRDELLSVGSPPVAAIERAACRALGITTEAVHLNAYVDGDGMFVARRSAHKQIDPGRWDNLVGGMVPAGESLLQALSREAFEEAGLRLNTSALLTGRRFQMRRPVAEGLQSEIIHVFDATLHGDETLVNQDGEVDAIELRSLNELVAAVERGEFTLESALVIVESLTRRSATETPVGLFS
ncbi:MAG: NUDIX domain-containing protein, partial [Burkholderiaceae bacterium]|nr:NUDIX domain-containing protein [Burkholderiaceae bacterium]